MKAGELGSKNRKRKSVPKYVWNKCKLKGTYMKCGRSNHKAQGCQDPSRATTPLCCSKAQQEPLEKKRMFHNRYFKIMEVGIEGDAGDK